MRTRGWALAVVINCHDREVIGYEFSLRGPAKQAERAPWTAMPQQLILRAALWRLR